MDRLFGFGGSVGDQAAVTDRVVAEARRLYRDLADDDVLERSARRAVAELWPESIKVTSFVSVLALRQVREILAAEDSRSDVGWSVDVGAVVGAR